MTMFSSHELRMYQVFVVKGVRFFIKLYFGSNVKLHCVEANWSHLVYKCLNAIL